LLTAGMAKDTAWRAADAVFAVAGLFTTTIVSGSIQAYEAAGPSNGKRYPFHRPIQPSPPNSTSSSKRMLHARCNTPPFVPDSLRK